MQFPRRRSKFSARSPRAAAPEQLEGEGAERSPRPGKSLKVLASPSFRQAGAQRGRSRPPAGGEGVGREDSKVQGLESEAGGGRGGRGGGRPGGGGGSSTLPAPREEPPRVSHAEVSLSLFALNTQIGFLRRGRGRGSRAAGSLRGCPAFTPPQVPSPTPTKPPLWLRDTLPARRSRPLGLRVPAGCASYGSRFPGRTKWSLPAG